MMIIIISMIIIVMKITAIDGDNDDEFYNVLQTSYSICIEWN